MIKRITVKNVATFDSEGVTIDNLQKVNFVYGGNACGKTTISKVLSCPDLSHEFPGCEVEWDGEPMKVITYNKDFREQNLHEHIPGVFTLGQASVEMTKEIEELSAKRDEISRLIKNAHDNAIIREEEIARLKNDRQELLWKNIYKKNEEFKACLKGFLYKNTFETKLLETIRKGLPTTLPNVEDLRKRYQVLFAVEGNPSMLPSIPESMDLVSALSEITDNPIWTRRIVGCEDVPIATLIKKLDITDWVRHGQSLLDHDTITCPFCQKQTIDADFRGQLERFFDENYLRDIQEVAELRARYEDLAKAVSVYYDDILSQVDSVLSDISNAASFVPIVQIIKEGMLSNLEMMSTKEKEPGVVLSFKSILEPAQTLQALIDSANEAIQKHNAIVNNLSAERESLKNDIWHYLGGLAAVEIKYIEKEIRGKEGALAHHKNDEVDARTRFNTINEEIQVKESQVTSVQPTITRINKALRLFGFTGFTIQPSPKDSNQYQIMRADGSWVENTLSEGETTFITFLYYMQLVRGSKSRSDIKTPRVLVIDDPISSLDSNVLFVVSTMIKSLLKDVRETTAGHESEIKQVFILTHNVYFHKDVSFYRNNKKCAPQTKHWILYKVKGVSKIDSCGTENPISSSYELLWRQVRDCKQNPGLTDNITLQNVIRRILDNYFKVFGGRKDIIVSSFSDPDEAMIATSFASWYDEGSHDLSDDLFVQNPQIANEKYLVVFERLFKELGHESHYNMMMHIEESDAD